MIKLIKPSDQAQRVDWNTLKEIPVNTTASLNLKDPMSHWDLVNGIGQAIHDGTKQIWNPRHKEQVFTVSQSGTELMAGMVFFGIPDLCIAFRRTTTRRFKPMIYIGLRKNDCIAVAPPLEWNFNDPLNTFEDFKDAVMAIARPLQKTLGVFCKTHNYEGVLAMSQLGSQVMRAQSYGPALYDLQRYDTAGQMVHHVGEVVGHYTAPIGQAEKMSLYTDLLEEALTAPSQWSS